MMTGAKRSEIWLANLDPQRGTEVGKVRPVIIVQTDLFEDTLLSSIILPVTTTPSKSELSKVKIEPNSLNGLEKTSWVIMDQIRAIDKRRLIKKLGNLDFETKNKVNSSLKIILDLI